MFELDHTVPIEIAGTARGRCSSAPVGRRAPRSGPLLRGEVSDDPMEMANSPEEPGFQAVGRRVGGHGRGVRHGPPRRSRRGDRRRSRSSPPTGQQTEGRRGTIAACPNPPRRVRPSAGIWSPLTSSARCSPARRTRTCGSSTTSCTVPARCTQRQRRPRVRRPVPGLDVRPSRRCPGGRAGIRVARLPFSFRGGVESVGQRDVARQVLAGQDVTPFALGTPTAAGELRWRRPEGGSTFTELFDPPRRLDRRGARALGRHPAQGAVRRCHGPAQDEPQHVALAAACSVDPPAAGRSGRQRVAGRQRLVVLRRPSDQVDRVDSGRAGGSRMHPARGRTKRVRRLPRLSRWCRTAGRPLCGRRWHGRSTASPRSPSRGCARSSATSTGRAERTGHARKWTVSTALVRWTMYTDARVRAVAVLPRRQRARISSGGADGRG